MADVRISALAAAVAANLQGTSLVPTTDSQGSPTTVKVTLAQMRTTLFTRATAGYAATDFLSLGGAAPPASGWIRIDGTTVTSSTPVFSAIQTWNQGATIFTGILLNVTNTASSASSLLIDLQLAAASMFKVDRTGTLTAANGINGQALTATTGLFTGLITGQNGLTISSGTSSLQALTATGAVIGTDPTGSGVTRTPSIRIGGTSRSGLIADDGTNIGFTKTGTGGYSFDAVITGTGAAFAAPTSTVLVAGRQGATNPAFQVDASTGLSVTGIKVTAAASGGGVAVAVISSSANENLTIDALGSGTITFAGTSTGIIAINRSLTVGGAGGTVASLGTIRLPNNNVIAWRNAANSADFTLRVGASNTFDFDASVTVPQGSKHALNAGATTYIIETSNITHNIDIVSNSTVAASFAGTSAIIGGSGGTVGFYTSAGIIKPTISGSRAGNAALASLLSALNNQGLISDSTSA